jgi:hypothetical protein
MSVLRRASCALTDPHVALDDLPDSASVPPQRQAGVHPPVFWLCGAEADHFTARSAGGQSDIDNLKTSCLVCNTRKGARALVDLGWEPPGADDKPWGGLVSTYRPVWEKAGKPDPTGIHKKWLRALESR